MIGGWTYSPVAKSGAEWARRCNCKQLVLAEQHATIDDAIVREKLLTDGNFA